MKYYLSKISSRFENPISVILLASILFVLLGIILTLSNTCLVTDYIDSSRHATSKNSIICKVL